jgi:hypothetical protein
MCIKNNALVVNTLNKSIKKIPLVAKNEELNNKKNTIEDGKLKPT